MQPEFWLNAWEEGRRGFHRAVVHSDLERFATEVFPAGSRVLVPLCGATVDLGWLRDHGFHAVGVELSPVAAAEVAEREGLSKVEDRGPFGCFEGPGITLLVGDFFALTPQIAGEIGAIWDRAALVALHPSQREAYVAIERSVLGEGALLLNVLTYDTSHGKGPPWSVTVDDVAALWPQARLLEVTETDLPDRLGGVGKRHLFAR